MEENDTLRAVGIGSWNPDQHTVSLDKDAQALLASTEQTLSLSAFSHLFLEADFLFELLRDSYSSACSARTLAPTLAESKRRIQLKLSSLTPDTCIITFLEFGNIALSNDKDELYRLVVNHAQDLLTLNDKDGYIRYISPSVYKLLSYMPDELLGADPYKVFFHPDEIAYIQDYLHDAILNGLQELKFQHRMRTKTGAYCWFETQAEPVFDQEGTLIYIQSTSRDITEQKETEDFLEETNQIALVGGWQYFPHSNQLEWTTETYHLHDLSVDTPITLQAAINYYHPDYRNRISQAVDTLIRTGEAYDLEAVLITNNNHERWVRVNGSPVWNQNGRLDRIRGVMADITDQKTMQRQLRKQEERNQQLVETVQEIIFWLDVSGSFIEINPMVYTVSGFTQSELKGEHYSRIIPQEYQQMVKDWFQEVLLASNPQLSHRIPILTKEQEWRWVDLTIQRRREDQEIQEVFGIARDVTNQALTQEQLALTSKRLETLIDNLQTGILLEDESQQVYLINEQFCKLFDLPYDPKQLTAANCQQLVNEAFQLFQSPSPEAFKSILDDNVQNQRTYKDYEITLTNGRTLTMDTVPIFHGDRYLGHLWQYHDVTQSKREAEELTRAKEQAEKASQAQADFLSTMSHEIRTPLNSVIGIAHILLEQNPRPDQMENLRALKFSGENLLNLINDILDFNKIEAGKIDLESRAFDLRNVIQGIRQTHSFQAEEKGLILDYQYDDRIPPFLKGDPIRISQIINNLVSNAIKFTDKGTVTIEVQRQGSRANIEDIYFAVVDSGPGIPEDSGSNIFQSFTQASNTTTRNHGGTGLGLSITQRLLKLYGSDLQVNSEEGVGTRFYFTLSLERAQQPSELVSSQSTEETYGHPSLQNFRILMAEDNEMNTFMAKQFLEKWKISVTTVENGRDAVQAAASDEYDLILMDLQMPEMVGYQAAEQIRQLPGYSSKPIIALTALAFAAVEEKVMRYQMDDHLTKPFNPSMLYEKLQQHLLPAD